jgi:hypothetical protein
MCEACGDKSYFSSFRDRKQLCDQSMKPYFPLRTSGIASFVAVIHGQFAETTLQAARR